MVKEGIAWAVPKTIVTPMEHTDPTLVFTNQPVIAPAVAINHVAQRRWKDCKKVAGIATVVFGEALIGVGCAAGMAALTEEIAGKMGATVAVMEGAVRGAGILAALCTFGVIWVTAECLTNIGST
ncbi:MAG: hypothetical protein OXF02_01240 [Simkaniaceae bacterium]|nr:hypothetical protein [Simkaniaceae bacterium]